MANTTEAEDQVTTFNYYGAPNDLEEDALEIFIRKTKDVAEVRLPVRDLRSLDPRAFNIDNHGFAILSHQSSLLPPLKPARAVDFADDTLLKAVYWNEIIDLLKQQYGCRSVVIINTTLRDVSTFPPLDPKNPRGADPHLAPFFLVHSDYTPPGVREHLRAITPAFFAANGREASTTPAARAEFFRLRDEIIAAEDAAVARAKLQSHWDWDGTGYSGEAPRYVMASIWRPLETVRRDPLAVMDARSVHHSRDVRTLPRVHRNRPGCVPEYKGANALPQPPEGCMKQGEEHRWYYLKDQTPEEVYVIKFYDSDAMKDEASGLARFCPHSAFMIDGVEEEEPRRSVELQAWMI
ncbi:hypothetical protein B0H19DRAFT_1378102, partial [Mycena capillaripes]